MGKWLSFDDRRATTDGREICGCEYQAVKSAAGRLDYWTGCVSERHYNLQLIATDRLNTSGPLCDVTRLCVCTCARAQLIRRTKAGLCHPHKGDSQRQGGLATLLQQAQLDNGNHGHGGVVVRLLASHGEACSISGRVNAGISHVAIVPDNTAGRRVFFRGCPVSPALAFRRFSIPRFAFIGSHDLDVKRRPNLFTHSLLRADEGGTRWKWDNAKMQGSPRKPAEQRHHPALFPRAKSESDPIGNRSQLTLVGDEHFRRVGRKAVPRWDTETGCAQPARSVYLISSLWVDPGNVMVTAERWTWFDSRRGRSRIFARGDRAGRCRWSAGFLGDILFSPPLNPSGSPYSPSFTLIGS
ncbi:hypothetical protein PR048_002492 [Dryococelus australis]|uniref:Uncharacterized protein n=1 Tax=Dryococelus australis TaxID=614101 RepID=A0ABQ9IKG5_9NEOP|nr:hypothetical protein PR048_002492 [Dryococelus australis]